MTNAQKLSAVGANGGTDCGVGLGYLNEHNMTASAVIMISDNQSWLQSNSTLRGETSMMREWATFKRRNKNAKLINIDISPYATTQSYERPDTLNVAGFSDQIFEVIASFLKDNGADIMIKAIDKLGDSFVFPTSEKR